ncbi:tetratricopeptide repeat protein [Rhodoplanes sp. Z2-YC6860]|uniref:tetratricopeptide repeat protein n=1 Tax=Rhodoplanes sp. Z2-YC6860 TaxID=674703 RepID=UPI00078DC5C4|nr:tetratricopeptide repeat protein [Rhodoplanes sp. Z2-YC6860]AMN43669.1 Tetratricopeptide TPR_2 repeat protein [Rhodoplanes sp. Z2-YC6860]
MSRAAAEYVAAQRINADHPEAHTALGTFSAQRGLPMEAEQEYRAALKLSPQFAAAAVNPADLLSEIGREYDGEEILLAAIAKLPPDAALRHALGLTCTRLKQTDNALIAVQTATDLDPPNAMYACVYAVALHSAGRVDQALAVLEQALSRRRIEIYCWR